MVVLTLSLVINVLFIFTLFFLMKLKDNKNKPIRELEVLLGILDLTIDNHILFKLKIEMEIKRKTTIITDYATELSDLTKKITNSFNKEFLHEFSYYYTNEYLSYYIVKRIELHLIKYMDEHKITTK
jgi:hypothetical protein